MLLTVSPAPSGPGRLLSRWCWFYSPLAAWRRNTRREWDNKRLDREREKKKRVMERHGESPIRELTERFVWWHGERPNKKGRKDGWMGPEIRVWEREREEEEEVKESETGQRDRRWREQREVKMGKIGGSGCGKGRRRKTDWCRWKVIDHWNSKREREREDSQQRVDRDPELTLKLAHQTDSDSSIIQFTLYLAT